MIWSCTAVKWKFKISKQKNFKQKKIKDQNLFFWEKKNICSEFQETSDELNSFSEFVDSD